MDYGYDTPKHDAREAIRYAIENQQNTIDGLKIRLDLAEESARSCRAQIEQYKAANAGLQRQLVALEELEANAKELEPVTTLPETMILPNGDTVRVAPKPVVFKATGAFTPPPPLTKVGLEPAILRTIGSDRQVDYLGIAHSVIGG
jgi:hypothetical protein